MTQPGSPGSAMPADESSVMRRLADLERQMRELGPSVADSFNSTVARVVSFDSIGASGIGFPGLTTWETRASGSAVTPEGFTSVTIMAIANAGFWNTAGDTFLQVGAEINGIQGGTVNVSLRGGWAAQGMATAIRTVPVTGGQTITCAARVMTANNVPTHSTNTAHIDAILLFRKA